MNNEPITPHNAGDKPIETTKPTKNTPLYIVMLVAGAALLAFFVGRQSAPSLAPSGAVSVAETAGGEAGEKGESGEAAEAGGEKHEEGEEGEHGHRPGEAIIFEEEALEEAGIAVAPVRVTQLSGGIPFNGEIEASPDKVVRVASVVPGRIVELFARIGGRVRRGQTLAIIESRAIGEAQSAYQQSAARLNNAKANLDVVLRQARAGVFSRAPVETARKAQVEAQAEVREQETAVRQAQVALDNAVRLARAGTFANPALEAARSQEAAAEESLKTAQAALDNAKASVESAQTELERRKQQAAAGAFQSRPVEEARRALTGARSAQRAAQSEVATTRANLARAKTLAAEGLVSQRDLEAAQNAFDTATANLESAQSDESTAQTELERQQKLAATNVTGTAEVQEAQSKLAGAQADVRTRQAEVSRAEQGVRLAEAVAKREQNVFSQGIANRREVSQARTTLEASRNALDRARQNLRLANTALERETRIFQQNLNNISQVQAARSTYSQAEADMKAARTALTLFKSSPSGSARVPIRAPLSGTVTERPVARGEVITADSPLMTIVDLSTVHVDMFLPERDISKVRVGSPVRANVDALPGRTFTGFVELIHSELDPKTRTVEAHADIANPGTLRPGMFARGRIMAGSGALVMAVPADAVQKLEGKTVVFVPGKKEGEFTSREVETGATQDGQTVITSGLRQGEKVVVKGAFMVKSQAMKAELAEDEH